MGGLHLLLLLFREKLVSGLEHLSSLLGLKGVQKKEMRHPHSSKKPHRAGLQSTGTCSYLQVLLSLQSCLGGPGSEGRTRGASGWVQAVLWMLGSRVGHETSAHIERRSHGRTLDTPPVGCSMRSANHRRNHAGLR